MVITCTNCFKKFELDSKLIPKNGRLLECSSCNHQWFFKPKNNVKKEKIKTLEQNNKQKLNETSIITHKKEISEGKEIGVMNIDNESFDHNDEFDIDKSIKKERKIKILNLIVVFIISFIAFIILIDTFKYPISKIIPNVEFILYNLYESIKDIKLFFNDLI